MNRRRHGFVRCGRHIKHWMMHPKKAGVAYVTITRGLNGWWFGVGRMLDHIRWEMDMNEYPTFQQARLAILREYPELDEVRRAW